MTHASPNVSLTRSRFSTLVRAKTSALPGMVSGLPSGPLLVKR